MASQVFFFFFFFFFRNEGYHAKTGILHAKTKVTSQLITVFAVHLLILFVSLFVLVIAALCASPFHLQTFHLILPGQNFLKLTQSFFRIAPTPFLS